MLTVSASPQEPPPAVLHLVVVVPTLASITSPPQSPTNFARTTLLQRRDRVFCFPARYSLHEVRPPQKTLHAVRRNRDLLIRGPRLLSRSLLWDATVLYGLTEPITESTIEAVENYYLTWWNGGMAVKMFMHIVVRPTLPRLSASRVHVD